MVDGEQNLLSISRDDAGNIKVAVPEAAIEDVGRRIMGKHTGDCCNRRASSRGSNEIV